MARAVTLSLEVSIAQWSPVGPATGDYQRGGLTQDEAEPGLGLRLLPPSPLAWALLRDGSEVRIRPMEAADKELLDAASGHLSNDSRYRRFLHPIEHLGPRHLTYLTDIDHHDHEALIAIDATEGEAVAVARYIRSKAEAEEAEFAIAVIDEWQGRGLGTQLLVRLMRRAREENVARFTALILSENRDALELIEQVAPEFFRADRARV